MHLKDGIRICLYHENIVVVTDLFSAHINVTVKTCYNLVSFLWNLIRRTSKFASRDFHTIKYIPQSLKSYHIITEYGGIL